MRTSSAAAPNFAGPKPWKVIVPGAGASTRSEPLPAGSVLAGGAALLPLVGMTTYLSQARHDHFEVAPPAIDRAVPDAPPTFMGPKAKQTGTDPLADAVSKDAKPVDLSDIDPLAPDCPLQDVTRHLATYNLVAVPIVDSEQRLLGAAGEAVGEIVDRGGGADLRAGRPPSSGA